jgi:hypothetical protein
MPEYPAITSKKIKYDSPSGFVNVGKYIPPFEPVKNGFGYMGVVIEDFKSGQLQCNICGKWFDQMAKHLQTHNMTSQEYKTKFGLSTSTALKTKKMRLRQSEIMIKLNKENPKCLNRSHTGFEKNNSYAGNRKGKPKSAETINKFGVCDLQIMDKIMKLKEKLGKTPSLIDLKKEYGGTFIFHIYKRYSSYIAFCKEVGFEPITSKDNPKYSREYFIEKGLSTEPSIRILTINEGRALYRYFKHGVKEWKKAVMEQKIK